MRIFLTTFFLLAFAPAAVWALTPVAQTPTTTTTDNTDAVIQACQLLAGRYQVVGKGLNTTKSFFGRATFTCLSDAKRMAIDKVVNGQRLKGEGWFTVSPHNTNVLVLVIAYGLRQRYEGHYIWSLADDGRVRITGEILPSKNKRRMTDPGLEAFFPLDNGSGKK